MDPIYVNPEEITHIHTLLGAAAPRLQLSLNNACKVPVSLFFLISDTRNWHMGGKKPQAIPAMAYPHQEEEWDRTPCHQTWELPPVIAQAISI